MTHTEAASSTFCTMPAGYFETLAAGQEGVQEMKAYRDLQWSTNMTMLSTVYNMARTAPIASPLASLPESMALLQSVETHGDDAQRAEAQVLVRSMLMRPATSNWLKTTVGRLSTLTAKEAERKHSNSPTWDAATGAERPLWVDMGYWNSLVASAAFQQGVDFTITVPIRHGRVFLPELGTAKLSDETGWGAAQVSRTAGQLWITSGDKKIVCGDPTVAQESAKWGVCWTPLHKAQSQTHTIPGYGDLQLNVTLDDADPFLGGLGASPNRLSEDELRQWRDTLGQAFAMLVESAPHFAQQLSGGLSVIVPDAQRELYEPTSSSSNTSIGAIRSSLPSNATEAAVILIHEYCGHAQLYKAQRALWELAIEDGKGATYYAPWRDDPRHIGGILHGGYSFSRVTELYLRLLGRFAEHSPPHNLAGFEAALWAPAAKQAIRTVLNTLPSRIPSRATVPTAGLNPWKRGLQRRTKAQSTSATPEAPIRDDERRAHCFIHNMGWQIDLDCGVLSTVGLPQIVRNLSQLVADDHRTLWNTYHMAPDQMTLTELTNIWLGRKRTPAPKSFELTSTIVPDPSACRLAMRGIYARRFLANPEGFREQLTNGTCAPGSLEEADRALIVGDSERAAAIYTRLVNKDRWSNEAFVGLLMADEGLRVAKDLAHVIFMLQDTIYAATHEIVDLRELTPWVRRLVRLRA